MAQSDVNKVIIEGTLHGQLVQTVLHYVTLNGALGPVEEVERLAEQVVAVVVPQLKAIQSAEYTHTRVLAQKIFPLPPRVPVINVTAAGAGGVAGQSLPTEVTAVITKKTPFAGRKYRGRIFVPGVPVTSELDSQLSAAAMTAWTAAADAMNVVLTHDLANNWTMVVWHNATKTYDTVQLLVPRPILRSQRNRQIGKGV